MRLPWLVEAAQATGYPVVQVAGWQTRGSDLFNPRGLVWHHTAGRSTGDMPTLNTLINGRDGLPGPLSQYGLGRSGTIYVVAAGRANHAGTGGWNGLVGNASVVGIEAEHVGTSNVPWPAAQLDAYRKLAAQILLRLGTTTAFMCGHKEWAPDRKIDPISLNMTDERARVAALMEEDMPLSPEDIEAVANATAQKVWFWLIHDSITGQQRGAAFHLRQAREDANKAANKAASGGASADEVADEIAQRLGNG